MTHEIFLCESCETNGIYKSERIFRRQGTQEVMTEEEFNQYYKENETTNHHIVVI